MIETGHEVVLWSSALDHRTKTHRSRQYKMIKINKNLEIRLIPSCGYTNHIGIRRLIDHAMMGWNLREILKRNHIVPDIAFIGYPPIETAAVMTKWLNKKNVPVMLDVKDLWPLIFLDKIPSIFKPFARILFHPYFYLARKVMKEADGISSMSNSFLEWCLSFSNKVKSKKNKIVRLTTPESKFEKKEIILSNSWWNELGIIKNAPKVFFTGTFSKAFDFEKIFIAAKLLKNCQFILCGHGPVLDDVKRCMHGLPNVYFPGWINRSQLESLARMSIATLAPYKNIQNFTLNIPNKIVDSLLLGLPILTPLKGEVENLVNKYNVGIIYKDGKSLANAISYLMDDYDLQRKMSLKARKLYNREFEFHKTYNTLVKHLEEMGKNG